MLSVRDFFLEMNQIFQLIILKSISSVPATSVPKQKLIFIYRGKYNLWWSTKRSEYDHVDETGQIANSNCTSSSFCVLSIDFLFPSKNKENQSKVVFVIVTDRETKSIKICFESRSVSTWLDYSAWENRSLKKLFKTTKKTISVDS